MGGGGGGLDRLGSWKGGMASLLAGYEVGLCDALGDACLCGGEFSAEYGLGAAEFGKGEGKLGAPDTEVTIDGGKADVGGLAPITSCMDGNDCLGGSWSSASRLGSTGDIIPGMLELPVVECE
jgi:hypothetical protein